MAWFLRYTCAIDFPICSSFVSVGRSIPTLHALPFGFSFPHITSPPTEVFFDGWAGHSFFYFFSFFSFFSGNSKRRLRRPSQNINQRTNAHKNINQHALALLGSLCWHLWQGAGEGVWVQSAHTANRGDAQASTLFCAIIPHGLHNFELCGDLFFHIIFFSASLMRIRKKYNMKKRQSRRNIVQIM